jgi:hypothetical protein
LHFCVVYNTILIPLFLKTMALDKNDSNIQFS